MKPCTSAAPCGAFFFDGNIPPRSALDAHAREQAKAWIFGSVMVVGDERMTEDGARALAGLPPPRPQYPAGRVLPG